MKAFPTDIRSPDGIGRANYDSGMDLRDYFAAKAMQGMCTGANAHDVFLAKDLIADAANEMADAMMKARK